MDANGYLLSSIISHDGDKQGTAFLWSFFVVVFGSSSYSKVLFWALLNSTMGAGNINEEEQVGDSPTGEPIQNSLPDQHLLPNN